ncbi:unannotated protein [freshwater metagenome]|uniref:Unannotated protein n=1 Tax=freshwater metagenome TaxID=449393 RepID=A0A6J6XEA4_9ZZZZ|nr:hypothetical protein [Actinomycetota bacterium]MSW62126.1 hypothetical protein [Actinomycetota bacterium]MSX89205.1 hypothetical protein [Actinomycetota bacterium]MSZ64394.1 hypothetical protein [Actinomycetota bacterium]MTA57952.1 hypothetical protein [Actinomycetota bacterium]
MSWIAKLNRSNRLAFIIGAILGTIAIKTQPDGNLLVTTVCALMGGSITFTVWTLLKKLRQR